jgi:phosphatidylserine decarboxylase
MPPAEPNLVLAAADGKIVGIEQIESEPHDGGKAVRISTFLSVFDVHVNRVPVSGVVDFVKWQGDRFRVAFADAASVDNRQSVVGIQTGSALVVVKQIVGIIARRIVCRLQNGDEVEMGDRFGLIRFGSRVDLILPVNSEIRVAVGDRVRAGVTVMGVLDDV